ncbi:hypothetical protein ACFCX4_19770 [Kitasatospora sp. NPDC056327]|uniref:hypothetical protein n=1 Tax=Kitasatospora sp. NPDC056327 TaxID=3345785 RepID=UPI0035E1A842
MQITRSGHARPESVAGEERTCPPAGPGTWAAAVVICLLAGAGPIIGFLSFSH